MQRPGLPVCWTQVVGRRKLPPCLPLHKHEHLITFVQGAVVILLQCNILSPSTDVLQMSLLQERRRRWRRRFFQIG